MRHAARLARLERMIRPDRGGYVADAADLLACITLPELAAMIAEAGEDGGETEAGEPHVDHRRPVESLSLDELASEIFTLYPDWLATCRARLRAKAAPNGGNALPPERVEG